MTGLFDTPVFAIIISIGAYEIGLFISRKLKVPIFNPLLIAIILVIWFISKFNISLESYNKGGNLIAIFLGPATVILAVQLFRQVENLKANIIPIIGGIIAGCITAVSSVIFLSRLFKLDKALSLSLIPKSVTTPIGMELSRQIGGIPPITMAAITVTGIVGAVFGPYICRVFRIKDKVAVGIAIGTSSHALGTTKAIEVGETEGAMSSLAIGIAGLVTVFIVPFLIRFL